MWWESSFTNNRSPFLALDIVRSNKIVPGKILTTINIHLVINPIECAVFKHHWLPFCKLYGWKPDEFIALLIKILVVSWFDYTFFVLLNF